MHMRLIADSSRASFYSKCWGPTSLAYMARLRDYGCCSVYVGKGRKTHCC